MESADNEHPQFKINKKKLGDRLTAIKNYSVGSTENALIFRMVSFLETKLPLSHNEISKYIIYCFKIYNEKYSIPLQKIVLLPQDERPKAMENLKSIFNMCFSEIIEAKKGTPAHYLLLIFEDYFKSYE